MKKIDEEIRQTTFSLYDSQQFNNEIIDAL